MKYQVASIQYNSKFLDKNYNIEHLSALVKEAAKKGARLIVLPEMCTTGYYFDGVEEIAPFAEQIPEGYTTTHFIRLAKELNCYIVVGIAERDGGNLYNSCFLVGPEGYWGHYRKIHPYTPDTLWMKNGDKQIKVFDTPIGKICMEICMDVSFPESARIANLLGAQILCVPTNWCEPIMPSSIWITRAYENNLFMVVSNRHGIEKGYEFSGCSCVINQDGAILDCVQDGDGIAYGTIDLVGMADNPEIPKRKPYMYKSLLIQHYHWPHNMLHRQYGSRVLKEGMESLCGIGQINVVKGDIKKNIENINEMIREASKQNVSLLCLPELALSGVPSSIEDAEKLALSIESKEIKYLAKQAFENGVFVCCGFVLKENGKYYNSIFCTLEDGDIYIYKKSHLTVSDSKWASSGNKTGIYLDLPIGRIGMLIGAEIMVTELPRILANEGCDLIIVPSAISNCCVSYKNFSNECCHWHIGRVRANENNTFILLANSNNYGGIFGPDMFVEPRQEIIAKEGSGLIQLGIDTRNIIYNEKEGKWEHNPVRDKLMLNTRQPYWYDVLTDLKIIKNGGFDHE